MTDSPTRESFLKMAEEFAKTHYTGGLPDQNDLAEEVADLLAKVAAEGDAEIRRLRAIVEPLERLVNHSETYYLIIERDDTREARYGVGISQYGVDDEDRPNVRGDTLAAALAAALKGIEK